VSDNSTTLLPPPETNADASGCDFIDAVRLEFHASLQLLAERACFLTAAEGCAIALEQKGTLIYCAATGTSEREPGSEAPAKLDAIRECLKTRRPALAFSFTGTFTLFVPVVSENQGTGFLELASRYDFPREMDDSLIRLANLVNVARELRDAAENAQHDILQASTNTPPPAPAPWRAPEKAVPPAAAENEKAPVSLAAPAVRTCSSCGFPVSAGRVLCVECDQKADIAPAVSTSMFATEERESWWSAHGYTIASLLVTIATAAIIVWLRR
jgi:hypothetical protein